MPENGCVLVVERGGSGGICQYTHALCAELTREGVAVELLTPPRMFLPTAGPAYPVHEKLALNIGRDRIRAALSEMRNVLTTVRLARRLNARAVVVQTSTPGRLDPAQLFLLHGLGIKIVWVAHDLAQYEWGGVLKPFARRLYGHVDAVITLSRAERDKLLAQVPDAEPDTHVVPHGDYRYLVTERMPQDRAMAQLGLEAGAGVLLFFGYLKPYKGVGDFVDAVIELHRRERRVHVLIAGRADSREAEAALRRRLHEGGLDCYVQLHCDYVANDAVAPYFRAADLVVLPYRDGTQSGVTHLAYAYGRPVVVTDVGGLAEDVRPGVTGEVARPCDARSIADAVERLLSDPDTLHSIQRDLEVAAPAWSAWPNVGRRYAEILGLVLGGEVPRL